MIMHVNVAECFAQWVTGNQIQSSQLLPVPIKELVNQGFGILLAIITQFIIFQLSTTDVIFNLVQCANLFQRFFGCFGFRFF